MTVALVLSGGGARGDFELGAIRLLYERGVRPDILVGSSVGAINAAKLAEGEGSPSRGLAGLISIWHALRWNDDMWTGAAWLSKIDIRLRRALLNQTSPALGQPPPPGEGLESLINFVGRAAWLADSGAAVL